MPILSPGVTTKAFLFPVRSLQILGESSGERRAHHDEPRTGHQFRIRPGDRGNAAGEGSGRPDESASRP